MQINLQSYVVRGSDGSVDEGATLDKFEATLSQYIAQRETELSTISDAVHAVFDQYKGTSINMPALTTFALQRLNAQPENYKALETRVQEFVRENSQGEVKDGVAAHPLSMFLINKGKAGGCRRRADIPAKA
jgi:phage tail tube protein FII